MKNDIEEMKEALIDLITYYRNDYHKSDWCNTDLINKVKNTDDIKELLLYEKIVDDWLDY